MTRLAITAASLLAACGSPITDLYEARRAELLADPGPAEEAWVPDGVLHLSPPLVDAAVQSGIEMYGAFQGTEEATGPLNVQGTVAYDLSVDRVDIRGTDRCERCVAIDARIGGEVDYRFGPARGSTPVSVRVGLDVRVDATADRALLWTVTLVPQEVREVEVRVSDLAAGIRGVVEEKVTAYAREALLARMEPIPVGTFGGEDLPIRAMSVQATDAGGVTLRFLTRSPTYAPLGDTQPKITQGWQLDLSQQSLIGIAARASLEAGELSHGVLAEPTALDIRHDGFSMGLRLWRPKGRGWWRDYTITGTVAIDEERIALAPTEVVEVAQSEGAVLADPLAAVGESVILSAIADSVNTSLPAFQQAEAQGMQVRLTVDSIRGSGGLLRIKGDLALSAAPPRRERPTRTGSGTAAPEPQRDGGMSRPAPVSEPRPAPRTRPRR